LDIGESLLDKWFEEVTIVGNGRGRVKTPTISTQPTFSECSQAELRAFKALLDGKGQGDLGEVRDLLPFFDANEQLCALMGTYNSNIDRAT